MWCGSIQALLSAPNPDDPLSENIAKHWKSNEAEAVETGKLIVLNINRILFFFFINNIFSYILKMLLFYIMKIAIKVSCYCWCWNFFYMVCVAKEWTRLYASGA